MSKKKSIQDPLSQAVIKNLNDKLYDKRKLGAIEVEQIVKDFNKEDDKGKIIELITFVHDSFLKTGSSSSKKGGLLAMASVSIGLSNDASKYVDHMVPPVLAKLVDPDNKVRYYACESLYNIARTTREDILKYFNEIFDEMCKLAADPDVNVRSAADILDELMKEIVTEGNSMINIEKFIAMVSKRIYVINPECRKFLVHWLMVLDTVPELNLIHYLPNFLDGLFKMLSDPNDAMRSYVVTTLYEFLQNLGTRYDKLDLRSVITILVPHCLAKDNHNFITSQTAITWINEFIGGAKEQILPYTDIILSGILPCVSHQNPSVEQLARKAHKCLLELVHQTKEQVDIKAIIEIVQRQFTNSRVPTRLASLKWILALHARSEVELMRFLNILYPLLLNILGDPAEDVVRVDLQVLSILSTNDIYFDKLMNSLVSLFYTDRKLLESRGILIIKQLCLTISSEKIYRTLATILESHENVEFTSTMVQTLNIILLTSLEARDTREKLMKLDSSNYDLFVCIYRSWCHNATALFSLCLLSQMYQHAADLVVKFSEVEVTINFLLEVDKLVQLLESPIFIYLRLQLLEPDRYPDLLKALYGILMILPQSSAFETLKNRLSCVSSLGTLLLLPKKKQDIKPPKDINFDELLKHFVAIQKAHSDYLREQRLEKEMNSSTVSLSPSPSSSNLTLIAKSDTK